MPLCFASLRYRVGRGNIVGLLVGTGVGSKTPTAGCSWESRSIGTHQEVEGGRVVEGLERGVGWCCLLTNGTWEDGLVHAVHAAANSVVECCCALVLFIWASTCCAGVVVVHIAAMCTAVVPVLKTFY